jgi:3-hydroxyisobutyrate dehydrogenase
MVDIGFIGLGNMGGPMAKNLVRAGHRVLGFDTAPACRDAAAADGIAAQASLGDAVGEADVVVTMLPAGRHVREVVAGDGGILASGTRAGLIIDCSTIDVESARTVHAAAAEAGCDFVDAPVSGGIAGAGAATLTFMVGGSEEAFARAKPILQCMGRAIIHAGGPGNGQAAKVCNNMILGISMIAVAEAFVLAEKLGLEAKTLFDISSKASGSCWAMLNHLPVPGIVEASAANRDYRPGFAAAMMLKDLGLAQQAALAAGAATPLGSEAAQLYGMFVNAGNGALDYSAIIRMIRGG